VAGFQGGFCRKSLNQYFSRPSEPIEYPVLSRVAGIDSGVIQEVAGLTGETPGAIGFDWVFVNQGGVPRLISWPRKKPITKNCKTAVFSRSLEIGFADLRIPA
jgi:hypothetical protein